MIFDSRLAFMRKKMGWASKEFCFIALFNNIRNLKFKSPPTVSFFAAVNQRSGSLRKRRN